MDIYLNGQIVPHADATMGIDDAGFQHAVGLFETMSVHHGRAFRVRQHLDRLATSSRELGLVRELNTTALLEAIDRTLKHNRIDRCRLRVTLTAGSLSMLRGSKADPRPAVGTDGWGDGSGGNTGGRFQPQPTIVIVPSEPTAYDPAYFERGITVLIAPPLANPFDPMSGHKTLNYWGRLRLLRQAAAAGAGEAIILNISNHIACGCVSNVFAVRNGELLTPIARGEEAEGALHAPVLPGITRQAIIELAEQNGITVHRKMLAIDDLLDADEIFLTNSAWQVLPVNTIEKKTIGSGKVGEVTAKLRLALLELIEKETAQDV